MMRDYVFDTDMLTELFLLLPTGDAEVSSVEVRNNLLIVEMVGDIFSDKKVRKFKITGLQVREIIE